MLRWVLTAFVLLGSIPAAMAVDELDAWDDFDSYGATSGPPLLITGTSGSQFSGGDGWATSGVDVGWEVDPAVTGASAQIYAPSLDLSSGGNLVTKEDFVVRRALRSTLTPTLAQPIWIGFQLQTALESSVSSNLATCLNSIQFLSGSSWSTSVLQFSMNTEGTRVDGVAGDLASPLRWRANQTDDPPSSVLAVDSNLHLVVMELETTRLSLWIYPSTTVTGIPFQTSAALGSALSFNRMQIQAAIFVFRGAQTSSVLELDRLAIGTSQLAVTSLSMPHVDTIIPASAADSGGDVVTISGAHFDSSSSVTIGTAAAAVTLIDAGTLQVVVPPSQPANTPGVVDVVVTNLSGQTLHAQSFTYTAPSSTDPSAVSPPLITPGGLHAGDVLTTTSGIWSPTPAGFTYQWQRSLLGNGSDVVAIGTNAPSYTLTSSDAGAFVRVVVSPSTVTHPLASAFLALPTYSVVAGAGPAISGGTQFQDLLTATPGSWTPTPPSFDDQWQRSPDGVSAFIDIPGPEAMTPSYHVQGADLGSYLRVRVTAHGTTSAAVSNVLFIPIPTLTGAGPVISGLAQYGALLTGTSGSWSPPPTGFSYQWQRSPTGVVANADAVTLTGETITTHAVSAADITQYLRLEVTAAGEPATPVFSDYVLIPPPTLTPGSGPTISGSSAPGGVLSSQPGSWSPPPPAFSYQWQLAIDASGTGVTDIAGATAATFSPSSAQLGQFLRVRVTITGTSYGASSAFTQSRYAKTASSFAAADTSTPGPSCGISGGLGVLVLGLLWQARRRCLPGK